MLDFMPDEGKLLGVVLFMCSMDILSGLIKAIVHGEVSSEIMRKGLWHKSAYLILIATGYVCTEYGSYFGLPNGVENIYKFVCGYIVLMELVSICENCAEANPALLLTKLFSIFGIKKEIEEKTNELPVGFVYGAVNAGADYDQENEKIKSEKSESEERSE